MKNKLGVMQGRLVPKYQGRYQAFPIGYWKDEFIVAQKCGLDLIEFILDFNDADENPLLKEGGVEEIKSIIKKTGVSVQTICADYFMEAPLHSANNVTTQESRKVMLRLLDAAKSLGVTDIVVPCVDQSSINGQEAADRFIENLTPVVRIAEKYGINLSLETDLAPQPFLELLEKFNSSRVTVNYDIGNSAALGFDSDEELNAYGDRITDIHIKDRVLGGGPVALGEGNADFEKFFTKLKEFNYDGPFIMQAYRDEEGVSIFKSQLDWVKKYISYMVKEIRHTGIVVNDLKKSLWFYKEKMGFKVFKYMDESGPFIDNILGMKDIEVTTVKMILKNNQMIELLDFYSHKKDILCDSINDIGPTHLAFTVDNLDDMYSDFSNEGIKFISAPKISEDGNVKVAFCKAPEGTHIELVELQ